MARPTEQTVEVARRDPEVQRAVRHSNELLVTAERLTHRLNVHSDDLQKLITERKNRESV